MPWLALALEGRCEMIQAEARATAVAVGSLLFGQGPRAGAGRAIGGGLAPAPVGVKMDVMFRDLVARQRQGSPQVTRQ